MGPLNDVNVEGYMIHIRSEDFTDISDAIPVGEEYVLNELLITKDNFPELVNSSAWFISVTAFDSNGIVKQPWMKDQRCGCTQPAFRGAKFREWI